MSQALALVYRAIDQVNAQLSDNQKIAKRPDTPLLDSDGGIDSLALVNLVVAIEQIVFDETDRTITIADENVYSSPDTPFRTVGSLAAYLDKMIA